MVNPYLPPKVVILDALKALMQSAFDAVPRQVGPAMTVINRSLAATDGTRLPVCRFYAPEDYLNRLASSARSTDWAGKHEDVYSFRLEYPPVKTITPATTLADLETQVLYDEWLVESTLTDLGNIKLVTIAAPAGLVAELAREAQVRNTVGQYTQDASNVVLLVEGRFTIRKKLYPSTATGLAAYNPEP